MQQFQEVFVVEGVAPDVRYARAAAWEGLRQILGGDDEAQWGFALANYQLTEVLDPTADEPTLGEPPKTVSACRYHIELARVEQEVAP